MYVNASDNQLREEEVRCEFCRTVMMLQDLMATSVDGGELRMICDTCRETMSNG